MCEGRDRAASGGASTFADYEIRQIFYAEGAQFHESDTDAREQWKRQSIQELTADPTVWRLTDTDLHERLGGYVRSWGWDRRGWSDEEIGRRLTRALEDAQSYSQLQYLERRFGDDFTVESDRTRAEYISHSQRIRYRIIIIQSKADFKEKLMEENAIVIYDGHSRYGRGTCFNDYDGAVDMHGDQWENGRTGCTNETGLFRLGFQYIAVPVEDIEHHAYHCAPMKIEDDPPARERRHPYSRHENMRRARRFMRVQLEEEMRNLVIARYRSPSHTYWGLRRERKVHLVLNAGWTGTISAPYDLGSIQQMNCRTFCHFGCSSKNHFWRIIRGGDYYPSFRYQRRPGPDGKLGYFTTAPANWKSCYWLHHLLACPYPNEGEDHWFRVHEYATRMANRQLGSRQERMGFRFY